MRIFVCVSVCLFVSLVCVQFYVYVSLSVCMYLCVCVCVYAHLFFFILFMRVYAHMSPSVCFVFVSCSCVLWFVYLSMNIRVYDCVPSILMCLSTFFLSHMAEHKGERGQTVTVNLLKINSLRRSKCFDILASIVFEK